MTYSMEQFCAEYPALAPLVPALQAAVEALVCCYRGGGKVLTCGNGGSAADSEHIVGELMKGFLRRRPLTEGERQALARSACPNPEAFAAGLQRGLPAISLVSQTALMTAFLNDVRPEMLFAQQAFAYGRPGDVLIALSTSGNSADVVHAACAARAREMTVIAFTGQGESRLSAAAGIVLRAPARETWRIQEYHMALYHALCAMVEAEFFPE